MTAAPRLNLIKFARREKRKMMLEGTVEQITDVIHAMAPQPVQEVRTEIRLVEDLGYDSLRLIELAIALERAFSLPEIGVHRSTTIISVQDVVDLVRELRAQQS